jgi:ribosomal-protein-alanine N-acetyltransferase
VGFFDCMTTMSSTSRTEMSPSLRTARLKLDAFTAGDAVDLHELFADPDTHTVGSGPFTALAQTQRWIANRVTALNSSGRRPITGG